VGDPIEGGGVVRELEFPAADPGSAQTSTGLVTTFRPHTRQSKARIARLSRSLAVAAEQPADAKSWSSVPLGPHCDVSGHRGRMSRDIVDTSPLRLVVATRVGA
jgi:hypothetical protein